MKKSHVDIFCDGSSLGNPGPGGFAALLQTTYRSKKIEKLLTGSAPVATNNQMELKAAILGLMSLKNSCIVHVYCDSNYVVQGMSQWMKQWLKQGFKNSAGKAVANRELWEELANAAAQHEVHWHWVKAHNGHPENERVDEAARIAAQSQQR